jgi:hypothetical protein
VDSLYAKRNKEEEEEKNLHFCGLRVNLHGLMLINARRQQFAVIKRENNFLFALNWPMLTQLWLKSI